MSLFTFSLNIIYMKAHYHNLIDIIEKKTHNKSILCNIEIYYMDTDSQYINYGCIL